jgi:hypothetical protein
MSLSQIKKKIKVLIEAETDERRLVRILAMLAEEDMGEAVKKRMQKVAGSSERDVKAGRVMDLDVFIEDTSRFIDELFEGKSKARSAAARRGGITKAG